MFISLVAILKKLSMKVLLKGYVEGYLRKSVVAEPLFNRKTLKTTHLQSSTSISFLAIK